MLLAHTLNQLLDVPFAFMAAVGTAGSEKCFRRKNPKKCEGVEKFVEGEFLSQK